MFRSRKVGCENGVLWVPRRESFQLGRKERPPGYGGLRDQLGKMERNGSGVVCEDRFPVMGNDTSKDPVMGKFSKYMGLTSKVQQKQQQRIKWNK